MSKRAADHDSSANRALKGGQREIEPEPGPDAGMDGIEGELEDPYGDSESEDEIFEAGVDGQPDGEGQQDDKGTCCPWTAGSAARPFSPNSR